MRVTNFWSQLVYVFRFFLPESEVRVGQPGQPRGQIPITQVPTAKAKRSGHSGRSRATRFARTKFHSGSTPSSALDRLTCPHGLYHVYGGLDSLIKSGSSFPEGGRTIRGHVMQNRLVRTEAGGTIVYSDARRRSRGESIWEISG